MDVAGIVDKLGETTEDRFAIGDRVIAYVIAFDTHKGAYAEQVVVGTASAVAAPRGATLQQAATLLLNGTTARLSLDALDLAAGETVAVIGGAGAVGGYAIQLAKADGLTVTADAAPADEELVRLLGADVILPRSSDIARAIRERAPEGAPGVIDTAALDAEALPAVADGGDLATLKGWAGPGERGITVHPISSYGSAADTALFERLRTQAEENVLTFRVADVLPALEAAEAHRRLAAGGVRGRLVLDFSQPIGSS
jgi:NADPH2:quinone reductase